MARPRRKHEEPNTEGPVHIVQEDAVAHSPDAPAPAQATDSPLPSVDETAPRESGMHLPRRRDTALATDKAAGMRLFANHESRKMAIVFDKKPGEGIRQMLKDAGWRWSQRENAWEKPVRWDTRVRDRMEAERLFDGIAALVRAEAGQGQAR